MNNLGMSYIVQYSSKNKMQGRVGNGRFGIETGESPSYIKVIQITLCLASEMGRS